MNDRCVPLDWASSLVPDVFDGAPAPGTTCTCAVRQRSSGQTVDCCRAFDEWVPCFAWDGDAEPYACSARNSQRSTGECQWVPCFTPDHDDEPLACPALLAEPYVFDLPVSCGLEWQR